MTHQPAPDQVIVRPSVADPGRQHQRYRIIPDYDEMDMAYSADYAEALARLLVWAHQDGCEIAEDVVAAALRKAAARLGGVERLIARRSGSWEASNVENLAGGWEYEATQAPPYPQVTDPHDLTERRAEPGELCTCGRQAIVVYLGGAFGPTGHCGIPDGGEWRGPCPFCGGPRHSEIEGRCPRYRLRLEG